MRKSRKGRTSRERKLLKEPTLAPAEGSQDSLVSCSDTWSCPRAHPVTAALPAKFSRISEVPLGAQPEGGDGLTETQHVAKAIISSAAAEGSALTLMLSLGKQTALSSLLVQHCTQALRQMYAVSEHKEHMLEQECWRSVLLVAATLEDALKEAAVCIEKYSFYYQMCNPQEVQKRVERSRAPLLALYTTAEGLFWEAFFDELVNIKTAAERVM